MEVGCNACHDVKQEDDGPRVVLNAEGNELCFTCHEDKRPQPSQLSVHAPVRKERCISCHEPHRSPNAYLLRRPTEGTDSAANLCLSCHGEIAAQLRKPVKHPAVDLGCAVCHTTHKSGPASAPEGVFHLSKPQPELCLDCHDAGDAGLQAAHRKQPFGRARCTECHNPHGSDQKKLLNNYVHPPFAERQCDTCHQEPKNGRVALVEGGRRELCLVCHADMQERLDKAKVKHAPVTGEAGCVACHSPHAANYPHQARRGPVQLCLSCHTNLAQARLGKAFLHQPVFELSCLVCHQEHAGDRPKRLRAEVNALCLECHGPKALDIVRGEKPVALFDGAVRLPAKPFDDLRWLQLGAGGRGHPLSNHLVSSAAQDGKPEINCLTCHLPHAANGSRELLVIEQANSSVLCVRCHK